MWLRRIWTRIRDTVVKKFSEWVDKECPLIEDEDDSVGEKTIKEVVDKSLLEESIISSLEKAYFIVLICYRMCDYARSNTYEIYGHSFGWYRRIIFTEAQG